jgi:hypothetical protein
VGGDWNTGSLWSGGVIPNTVSADVTIDALTTLVPYTVTIASNETETVRSLSLNAVNNRANAEYPYTYIAAELELDGTLIFAAGSAGTLAGSGQTFVHVGTHASAAIQNGGTLNGFIQVQGNLLLTGTNGVYITNEIQALGGTVTINAPFATAELAGATLTDGHQPRRPIRGSIRQHRHARRAVQWLDRAEPRRRDRRDQRMERVCLRAGRDVADDDR